MECVFNNFPEHENGYILWELEVGGSKFIIIRCITFIVACKEKKVKT